MGRWNNYGQSDVKWAKDGDVGWKGIDMLTERGSVQPGYLSRGENTRLRDGVCRKRGRSFLPEDFNPGFTHRIIGAAIFKNPNGDEVMLIATAGDDYVWVLQYGKDPYKVLYDGTVPIASRNNGVGGVQFCQSFQNVVLMRAGSGLPGVKNLFWDGTSSGTWKEVALSADGLVLVPPRNVGEPFQDRILFYNPYYPTNVEGARDSFIRTDIQDYTSYDDVFGVIRVNAGESDLLVRILPYFRGSVIVGMKGAIHMVENVSALDFRTVTQRLLTSRRGVVGIRSMILHGGEVYVLSEPEGIFKLSELIQDQIAADPIPISRRIQPVIDKINWGVAHNWACSEKVAELIFFFVPIEDDRLGPVGGGNNAALVFDTSRNEWVSGFDWWDDIFFRVNTALVTYYNGRRALFGVDNANAKVYLLYEDDNAVDLINGRDRSVKFMMETRGLLATDGFTRAQRASLVVQTYDPAAVVTAVQDGIGEETTLGTIEKSNRVFYPLGHPDYNPDTGDPQEPYREDYSVGAQEAIEDFEGLPDGDLLFIPGSVVEFNGLIQQSVERFEILENGRWHSIRVTDEGGKCDVLAVSIEGIPIEDTFRTLA